MHHDFHRPLGNKDIFCEVSSDLIARIDAESLRLGSLVDDDDRFTLTADSVRIAPLQLDGQREDFAT
ncbi:MAG: hypothetical protein HXM99_03975 [Porphyromonadaceae bacterium]|nr:hypothetical protein [Porphyromonadaceae bacterium]